LDSDKKSELRRRKGKGIDSESFKEAIRQEPEIKSVEEKKPEWKETVAKKEEADSQMQEAQGPKKQQKEEIWMEDSL
jgi:hypothetical protein